MEDQLQIKTCIRTDRPILMINHRSISTRSEHNTLVLLKRHKNHRKTIHLSVPEESAEPNYYTMAKIIFLNITEYLKVSYHIC